MTDAKLVVSVEGRDNLSPAMKKMESTVIRVVGSISAALTALSVIGKPITLAAEFQKQMVEVQKTTNFSDRAIRSLSQGIRELARNINVSAPELAKIAALGGQLGVGDRGGANALIKFTEEIARAVTALDVDAEEAATSLGKLINVFNVDESQYGSVIAAINKVSNVSTAKPEELFDIMRRMGSLGESITIDQSAALSALAIDVGLTAETAGTSFEKIFADMKSKAGEFASFIGVSLNEWVEPLTTGNGIKSLKAYLSRLNELPEEVAAEKMIALTGGGRIFSLVNKLRQQMKLGEDSKLDQLLKTAADELKLGTSAIQEQQNVLTTLSAQWQVFKNRIADVGIAAGDTTLPAFTNLLKVLGQAFSDTATIDTFTKALSAIASAVDVVAIGIAKLGSVGGLLSFVFDVSVLLFFIITMKRAGLVTVEEAAKMAEARKSAAVQSMAAIDSLLAKEAQAAEKIRAENQKVINSYDAIAKKLEAMSAASARYTAQQEVNAAKEALAAAERERVAARQAFAQFATNSVSLVPEKARSNYVASMQKVNADRLAAEQKHAADITALTSRKNAVLASMEAAYQAEIAGITGKGSKARRAAVTESYLADVAVTEASFTRMSSVIEKSYSKDILAAKRREQGLTTAYHNAIALATEEARIVARDSAFISAEYAKTAQAALAAAEAKLAASKIALEAVNAELRVMEQAAAAEIATNRAVATSFKARALAIAVSMKNTTLSLAGSTISLLGAGAALDTFKIKWTELGARAATATGIMSNSLIVLNRGLALTTLAFSTLGAAINKALLVYVFVDMAAWILKLTGLLDPLIGQVNKLIDAWNNFAPASLSIGKFSTTAEVEKLNAALKESREEFERLKAAADTFDARFAGGLSTRNVKGVEDSFIQDFLAYEKRMDKLRENVEKGMKFDIESPQKVSDTIEEAVQFLSMASGKAQFLSKDMQSVAGRSADYAAQLGKAVAEYQELYQQSRVAEAKRLLAPSAFGSSVSYASVEAQKALEAGAAKIVGLQHKINELQSIAVKDSLVLKRLEEDRYAVFASMAKGLSSNYVTEVLDSGKLEKYQKIEKEILATEKELRNLGPVSVTSIEQSRPEALKVEELQGKLNSLKAAYKEAASDIAGLGSVISITAGKSDLEAAKMVSSLGTVAEQSNYVARVVAGNGGDITKAFQGTSSAAVVSTDQLLAQAARYAAYKGMINANKANLSIFKSEAEAARKSVETTFAAYRRSAREMAEFVEGIAIKLKAARDDSGADIKDRAIDDKYEAISYTDSLRIQKKREQLDLDRQQLGLSDAEYEKRKRVLDLEERGLQRKVDDAKAVEKANVAWTAQEAKVNGLLLNLTEYNTRLGIVSQRIENAAPGTDLTADIAKREEMLRKIEETKKAAEGLVSSMASTPDVMGKVIGDPAKVEEAAKALADLTVESAKYANSSAEGTAKFLESRLSSMEGKMTVWAGEADKIAANMLAFVSRTGDGINTVVEATTKATTVLEQEISDLGEEMNRLATTDFGLFRNLDTSAAVDALIASTKQKLSEAKFDLGQATTFSIKADTIYGELTRVFSELNSKKKGGGAEVDVDANFSSQQINESLQANAKGLSVDVNANVKTSGGGIAGRADGGPIRGRGTSRSDSILSWLSHGEYVIDALTTRMFGEGFFANLQSIAKTGNVLGILPRFADGGPVGSGFRMPDLNIIAGGESSVTDVVRLDISLGGSRRSSVMGSREQINGLVEALKEIRRGT